MIVSASSGSRHKTQLATCRIISSSVEQRRIFPKGKLL